MIIKVAKNELIKTFHHKQFYILLTFIILLVLLVTVLHNSRYNEIIREEFEPNQYSEEVVDSYIHMNANGFMSAFMTDFIYKPMIPFFVIFMILFSIRTFSEDNTSGNLKFFILDTNKRTDIFYGKILYLFIIISIVNIINLILGFSLGTIFFGREGATAKEFLMICNICFLIIIPVLAFSALIGVISLASKKSSTFNVIGIMSAILISVIDSNTISKNFSPIGIIAKVMDAYDSSTKITDIQFADLIQSNLVALIYLIISIIIGTIIFRKKDWVY